MHNDKSSKRPPAAMSQSLPRLPHHYYYPSIQNNINNNILRANYHRGGGDYDMNMNHHNISNKWNAIKSNVASQYAQRIAADPNFLKKSILEVCLAASTQFMAEMNRRHGMHGVIVEIDFVVAGILTAVAGKYYSMWRVAPTSSNTNTVNDVQQQNSCSSLTSFWDKVPTNAFQSSSDEFYTPMMRMASFVKPAPTLFRAGIIASAIGYGLTAVLISLRSILVKTYIPKTQNVNVIAACLYTGGFMAVVSNLRYQLLQGVVEPLCIDGPFANIPSVRAVLIFLVRLGNGFLGSVLAI
eukprot:CAMPEP_0196818718 /NCGR_PEP_ID=MMETSP1362-20130617/67080_1 /TAXON_ID=163516 /ORGANISM="Leptocylindrus danicus, Strain CCMP1856" /LENGTH=296 /DNA_ID=CAMNT_0042196925 /DNA_START=181 /DNA_END=1068 /DNA_ORIENTATION=+